MGSIVEDVFCWRRTLKELFQNKNRFALALAAVFAIFLLMIAAALSAFAQRRTISPYQDEQDGVSAGGRWMEYRSEGKMTSPQKLRFELLSNNYLREDPRSKPPV